MRSVEDPFGRLRSVEGPFGRLRSDRNVVCGTTSGGCVVCWTNCWLAWRKTKRTVMKSECAYPLDTQKHNITHHMSLYLPHVHSPRPKKDILCIQLFRQSILLYITAFTKVGLLTCSLGSGGQGANGKKEVRCLHDVVELHSVVHR